MDTWVSVTLIALGCLAVSLLGGLALGALIKWGNQRLDPWLVMADKDRKRPEECECVPSWDCDACPRVPYRDGDGWS